GGCSRACGGDGTAVGRYNRKSSWLSVGGVLLRSAVCVMGLGWRHRCSHSGGGIHFSFYLLRGPSPERKSGTDFLCAIRDTERGGHRCTFPGFGHPFVGAAAFGDCAPSAQC